MNFDPKCDYGIMNSPPSSVINWVIALMIKSVGGSFWIQYLGSANLIPSHFPRETKDRGGEGGGERGAAPDNLWMLFSKMTRLQLVDIYKSHCKRKASA